MRKTVNILVLVVSVLAPFSFVQCSKKATDNLPPSIASVAPLKGQWEYLIVSFGKTLFSSPNEEPESKTMGLSKLISYSKAGIVSAQEAMITQSQIDSLGKFGWELIGIVGAIGGDQQMVFKRAYNLEQSKKEAELIRQEGERLLAAKNEEEARLAAVAKATATELVDMDAFDEASAITETRRKEEMRLKDAIASVKDQRIVDVKVNSSAQKPKDSSVTANLTFDGTKELLTDGNKYRLSKARDLAKSIAKNACVAARLKDVTELYGEVTVQVSLQIIFHGVPQIVAIEKMAGWWPERQGLW